MSKNLLLILLAASFIPVFRSGGRGSLNFWEFVWNHTIWGPDVEYIPEEDYQNQISQNGQEVQYNGH